MWTAGTILVATFLASITDWLFMDLLVHRAYIAESAIWRPSSGSSRIVISQIVGTVATASAILLERMTPINPLLLATALWCAGALPICMQNTQWLRMKPSIGISHAMGWLARLAIATCLARVSQP